MSQEQTSDYIRERLDKDEAAHRAAHEQFSENEAELKREPLPGTEHQPAEGEEARTARQEAEAEQRFETIAGKLREERDKG